MAHTPHELAEDFPSQVDAIRALRERDAHFARLCDEYHEANRAVHRIETDVEPCSDERASALRRTRMQLKDEIAAILAREGAEES